MRLTFRFSFTATRTLRVAAAAFVLLLMASACSSSSGSETTSMTAATELTNTATPAPIRNAANRPRPVVVDTDLGADDVLALLFLLESSAADVRAITVSGTGLVHCDPGVRHVRSLLALVGGADIPVACGRETPLQGDRAFPEPRRADADRLYGIMLPDPPGAISALGAPELLAGVLESSTEGVTVLTLGPLTNIADMLTANPDAVGANDLVFATGGALEVPGSVAGPGNFSVDPEAARIVFESGALITLVPRDVAGDASFVAGLAALLAEDRSRPAHGILAEMFAGNPALMGPELVMWDAVTAAVLVDETLAVFEMRTVDVVGGTGPDAGTVIEGAGGARIRVAVSADRDPLERLYVETLGLGGALADDEIGATETVEVYGEIVWEFSLEGEYDGSLEGLHSRPVVADGVVYFGGSNGTAYALDLETGAEIWSFSVGEEFGITDFVALSDHAVFFRERDGFGIALIAVERNTGMELWRFLPPEGETRVRNPVFTDGVVYTGTSDFFYALDAETGEELWRFRTEGGAPGPAAPPIVVDGVAYFGTPAALLYAVDVDSHEELWAFQAGSSGFGVASVPVVADGVAYFGSDDATFYAVDVSNGEEIWRFAAPGPLPSSPAVADGRVFFGALGFGDGRPLFALDQRTGDLVWRSTNGGIISSPAVAKGAVYVGSGDGNLYVVDATSGDQLWRFRTETAIGSSPVVVDGVVYFLSGLTFFAVKAPS